jgi:hypothetical protein
VDESQPSKRVVDQRIRNRIIEYFELAASYESQLAYERDVPIAHVPYEVINQWEDWVPPAPMKMVNDLRVFSTAELQAIEDFQPVWEATAAAVPDDYPPLSAVQALPAWDELRRQALIALGVFQVRGKLPEDQEAEG